MNSGKPLITDHTAEPTGNQSLPLFIVGVCILIAFIATDCCGSCLKAIHLMPSDDVELINEDIGSYFECVPINERKRWYAQELYANKRLGISTMGDYSREQIRTKNGDYRVIKNAPNYEILSNINYCQQFQFTPIDMCDTQEEQEISDMILKCLYMGYALPGYQDFDFKRILAKRGHKHAAFAKAKDILKKKKATEEEP